ncbi:MAG: hypothetical protein CBD09_01100 [Puniceicoccaceae bacterium TMED149]|nr:MAG: hypothetical protein CBD09_01100 [Puniceicoccaceae bacterium TMED149]|tara:strand:+ start:11942 stop:12541 length:600 start_codon:yes stop_codon:yes gene_type:complete
MEFFAYTGIFIYPLTVCSVLAVYFSLERFLALRECVTLSDAFVSNVLANTIDKNTVRKESLMYRLIRFFDNNPSQDDERLVQAFVQLELNRLQKGLFILDIIAGIAPFIGLLGTVIGLTDVFGAFLSDSGFSDQETFVRGIALALNTTILGLMIAIPSSAMYSFLSRRIDVIESMLELCVEGLFNRRRSNHEYQKNQKA